MGIAAKGKSTNALDIISIKSIAGKPEKRRCPGWIFVKFTGYCKSPLKEALKECFSYSVDPATDTASLVGHFIGENKQAHVAETLSVSRSTISRWMQGSISLTLMQMLELMNFGSVDFYRFIEMLTQASLFLRFMRKLL